MFFISGGSLLSRCECFFCYFARLVLKLILQSLFLTFKMAVDKVSHYISPLCHLTAVKNILNVILLRLKFDDLS